VFEIKYFMLQQHPKVSDASLSSGDPTCSRCHNLMPFHFNDGLRPQILSNG